MMTLLWVIRRIKLTGPKKKKSSLASSIFHVGHTFQGGGYVIPAGLGDQNCVVSACNCAWLMGLLSSAPTMTCCLCCWWLYCYVCTFCRTQHVLIFTVPKPELLRVSLLLYEEGIFVNSAVWIMSDISSSVAQDVFTILVITKMEKEPFLSQSLLLLLSWFKLFWIGIKRKYILRWEHIQMGCL